MQPGKQRRAAWRRFLRGPLRWSGPPLLVLIGAAWPLSMRWSVRLGLHIPARAPGGVAWTQRYLEVSDGTLEYSRYTGIVTPTDKRVSIRLAYEIRRVHTYSRPRGLPTGFVVPTGPSRWTARWSRAGEPPFVAVPLWMPLAAAVVPTVPALLAFVRALRRFKEGQCPNCGYDLVGLAEGAPCPECGQIPPASASSHLSPSSHRSHSSGSPPV